MAQRIVLLIVEMDQANCIKMIMVVIHQMEATAKVAKKLNATLKITKVIK